MALTLELKAGERVLLGETVIVNQGGRARLTIEGDTPVLRERDLIAPEAATSAAGRLYLAMQSLYLARAARGAIAAAIAGLAREIVAAEPARRPAIEAIERAVGAGEVYRALRETKRLISNEGQVASAG